MNLRLIGVEDGKENMCSCGYSSERYWTNDSSSNIFPAGIAWAEDPAGNKLCKKIAQLVCDATSNRRSRWFLLVEEAKAMPAESVRLQTEINRH